MSEVPVTGYWRKGEIIVAESAFPLQKQLQSVMGSFWNILGGGIALEAAGEGKENCKNDAPPPAGGAYDESETLPETRENVCHKTLYCQAA